MESEEKSPPGPHGKEGVDVSLVKACTIDSIYNIGAPYDHFRTLGKGVFEFDHPYGDHYKVGDVLPWCVKQFDSLYVITPDKTW